MMSVPRFAAEAVFESPLRLRSYRTPVRVTSAAYGAAHPAQLAPGDELQAGYLASPDGTDSETQAVDTLEGLSGSGLIEEPGSDPLLDEPSVDGSLAPEPGLDSLMADDVGELTPGDAGVV